MSYPHHESRRCFFEHPALRIEGASARAAKNYRTQQVVTETSQIIIPVRGAFVYELASSQYLVTANHALLIAAGDESRDRFIDQEPLSYMLITPTADAGRLACESLLNALRLKTGTRVAGSSVRLQHAASTFWNLCVSDSWVDASERLESALHLLAVATESAGVNQSARCRGASRLVGAVKDLIGTGGLRLSLTAIAAQVDASPAYLTTLFRRNEGVTIARYQRRLRLSRALLDLPHAENLTALALELGFSSHAHFCSTFRAVFGEAPSAYRRRMRSGCWRDHASNQRDVKV